MAKTRPTTPIGTKISNEQYAVLMDVLDGETPADYLRRLIEADMAVRGVAWPEYEFITPEERRGMKGLPWIDYEKRVNPAKKGG